MRSPAFVILLLVLALGLPSPAAAINITKIGYVNLSRILAAVPALQAAARSTAPPARPATDANAREIVTALKGLSDTYYSSLLDELTAPAPLATLTNDIEALQSLIVNANAAPAAEVSTGGMVVGGGAMDRILRAVQRIGQEQGFSLILEKNNILYGAPALDITDQVIALLRNESR